MTAHSRRARYELTFHPAIATDLAALAALDPDSLTAFEAILDDLASGGVTGKTLGDRRVSGDLTGFVRVKFDTPGRRPQRFRLVYQESGPSTRDVLAVGPRDEHAIYRAAVDRLGAVPPAGSTQ